VDTQLKATILLGALSLLAVTQRVQAQTTITTISEGKSSAIISGMHTLDDCQSTQFELSGAHSVDGTGPDTPDTERYRLGFTYSYYNTCTQESAYLTFERGGSTPNELVVKKSTQTADIVFAADLTFQKCSALDGEPICTERSVPVVLELHATPSGVFSESRGKSSSQTVNETYTTRYTQELVYADVAYRFLIDGESLEFVARGAGLYFQKFVYTRVTTYP
jgi:hypothetical protein